MKNDAHPIVTGQSAASAGARRLIRRALYGLLLLALMGCEEEFDSPEAAMSALETAMAEGDEDRTAEIASAGCWPSDDSTVCTRVFSYMRRPERGGIRRRAPTLWSADRRRAVIPVERTHPDADLPPAYCFERVDESFRWTGIIPTRDANYYLHAQGLPEGEPCIGAVQRSYHPNGPPEPIDGPWPDAVR